MRIISVLWRILPSGCNFYLQSGPSLSGSDSCEYQPTSLIRAARPSWQPGAELFCLQLNVPGLFFFFFQSVVQSASFSILRGNGAGDGKHIKPALSGETKQCWGRQTLRCWLNFPFFCEVCVNITYVFKNVFILTDVLQGEELDDLSPLCLKVSFLKRNLR